jgi:EAL domain-containing protein (putative c-di-GMP-specific phosphodiesterase class I)
MRRAASDAVAWPGIRLAVNVSPAQFRRSDFASMAAKVLADTGFAPELLEIEVTETYFLTHPDRALTAINALRRLGVTIVLDDFGTGYSSIGYLRRFKFDKLKLDRSLVANLVTDSETQRVVHATIALATSLGLRVTAEGIETEDQALLVRAAGCHELQGFLFDKALTAAEMTGRLHAGAAPRQVISAA